MPPQHDIGQNAPPAMPRGSIVEVLLAFLRLGCTSFGGPIAHLGYFREEFVQRRRWCTERTLAELIAIAQSLPGPASSQVGFALGILRAGWLGGIAAWVGFTSPSAILMLLFAFGVSFLDRGVGRGLVHGLHLVAVAVVAQAVLGMQRTLAPDRARMGLVLLAAGIALILPAQTATLAAILAGALFGILIPAAKQRQPPDDPWLPLSKAPGMIAAVLFLLLFSLSLVAAGAAHPSAAIFSALYRCGALVFGGGHVVLPLLEDAIVAKGWIGQQTFLAGYGAAQALPGPLFSIGAFLGAAAHPGPHAWLYGCIGLVAIFLPGLLAMAAILPIWSSLRSNRLLSSILIGINASVVGVLVAALFTPLWTSAIRSPLDFWIALAAFTALTFGKAKPWMVVIGVSLLSIVLYAASAAAS